MLIAYDSSGNVVATLGHLVHRDASGRKYLVDLEAAEPDVLQIWEVQAAVGAKFWPDAVVRPHDWRVEKSGPDGAKHLSALTHRVSGERLERTTPPKKGR